MSQAGTFHVVNAAARSRARTLPERKGSSEMKERGVEVKKYMLMVGWLGVGVI